MTIPDRWARGVSTAGLGVTFLAAIAIQAVALAQTWGAPFWVPGAAAAVVVCGLAMMRRRERTWTAVAGLVVAALAVLIPLLPGTELPAGLGPSMALGLGVLIGSAVRALPTVRAVAIAGAGLLVIAAQLAARPTSAVVAIAAAAWLAALGAGLSLRMRRPASRGRSRCGPSTSMPTRTSTRPPSTPSPPACGSRRVSRSA